MSIPAGIPAGFLAHCNHATKKPVQYDHVNYVSSLPASEQAFLTPTGVPLENQRIALDAGPRGYFEYTRCGGTSGATTDEIIILT